MYPWLLLIVLVSLPLPIGVDRGGGRGGGLCKTFSKIFESSPLYSLLPFRAKTTFFKCIELNWLIEKISFDLDKLALNIFLDILNGTIEKKPAPGDHKPHLNKWILPLSPIGCIKEEIQIFLFNLLFNKKGNIV